MDTSVLDLRLAPDDFHGRICLVKTMMPPPNNDHEAIAAGNTVAAAVVNPGDDDEVVSAHRLWPALKFDSHRELMELIKTRVRPSDLSTKLQTSLTVEWNLLLPRDDDPNNNRKSKKGIAYLIGRGGGSRSPSSRLVTLSANSDEVFDFYMHYEEMHAGRGSHCGSEQFQSAFKLAFDRMTCSTGMETDDDDKEACSGRKSALEASTVEVLNTPQHPPQHATKFVATSTRGFTPVTGSSSSSDEDKLPTSPAIKEEDIEMDDEVVEAARFTTSAATSMPQLDFPGNTIEVGMAGRVAEEISKDVAHYPQAESPNVTWNDLWIQMINAGWKICAGDNFGSLYYIHPSAARMRKTNMLRSCTEGIHYFSSEDAIHRYATLHLGWAGEGASKSSPATLVLRARENKKESRITPCRLMHRLLRKRVRPCLYQRGAGAGATEG